MYGYEIGDFVRVLRGPFEGFPGTVTGADGGNLVVDVEVFGKSTPVILPPEDIARIDRGEGDGGSPVREPRSPRGPIGSDAIEIDIESDEATP